MRMRTRLLFCRCWSRSSIDRFPLVVTSRLCPHLWEGRFFERFAGWRGLSIDKGCILGTPTNPADEQMKRIYFRLELGLKSDKIPNTTMNHAPLKDSTYPSIPAELKEYADVVRESIENGDCEIFLNSSHPHAAVIMQLFCEAAQETLYIFCGHLNKLVYEKLWPVFKCALERAVDVRVLTETNDVESIELAKQLQNAGVLRCLNPNPDLPHFAIIDSRMSRLETSREKCSALVRTNVASDDLVGQERMRLLQNVFCKLWESAKPVELA